MIDWVWIGTITTLPINRTIKQQLKGYKVCLVCPDRWGRAGDIPRYIQELKSLDFRPDAVMTAENYVQQWKKFDSFFHR